MYRVLLDPIRNNKATSRHRKLRLTGKQTDNPGQLLVHASIDDVALREDSVGVVTQNRWRHLVLRGWSFKIPGQPPCNSIVLA